MKKKVRWYWKVIVPLSSSHLNIWDIIHAACSTQGLVTCECLILRSMYEQYESLPVRLCRSICFCFCFNFPYNDTMCEIPLDVKLLGNLLTLPTFALPTGLCSCSHWVEVHAAKTWQQGAVLFAFLSVCDPWVLFHDCLFTAELSVN